MHDPALPPRTRLRKVALVGGGVFLFFLAAFLIRALVSFGSPPFLDMVSGTEYISGEYGQVIARLTDRSDNPIADASCTVTVVYPDKSYFLLDAAMQQSAEPGNYYREFTTPTITGIYEETVTCSFTRLGKPSAIKISSSFHVSVALNFIVDLSIREREHYDDLLRRINATYEELLRQFTESNLNFNQINESIKSGYQGLSGEVQQQFNQTNTILTTQNQDLYADLRDLGAAYINIFGVPQP
ncbi:hypothetical protein J4419_01855 [Candidatus Woesearchaeota archaeon]|nr:hypothetical protein [Candidatus Woesearchaeota archaeon]